MQTAREKIRVLQILPTLGAGGIASVVRNYYSAIDHDRFVFDFVTHGNREDFHKSLEDGGSHIYYVGTIPQNGIFRYFKKMRCILREGHYSVVHFHTRKVRLLLLPCARRSGAKVLIVHAHSTSPGRFQRFWAWWASIWATKFLACGLDAGCAIWGKHEFEVLPNSVDIKKFTCVPDEKIAEFRTQMSCKAHTLLIGTVGAIIALKNQIFLIDIAKILETAKLDYKVVIVGEGVLRGELETRIRQAGLGEHFILTGQRSDVEVCMNAFDCYVMPSLFEGLPVAGVEAQVGGCPCLFSTAITREIDLGFVPVTFLPLNNAADWSKEILIKRAPKPTSSERYEKLKDNAFSLTRTAIRLEEIYEGAE